MIHIIIDNITVTTFTKEIISILFCSDIRDLPMRQSDTATIPAYAFLHKDGVKGNDAPFLTSDGEPVVSGAQVVKAASLCNLARFKVKVCPSIIK